MGLVYIALRIQHEPLDQIDLSNGLDASSKAVGNRRRKLADRWAHQGPDGPTCHVGSAHEMNIYLLAFQHAERMAVSGVVGTT